MATGVAEKPTESVLTFRGETPPQEYHWSVESYYRAWEAGVFGHDVRLELVQGRIIEKMPPSPLHTSLVAYIADCLRAVFKPPLTVRSEAAIHIAFDGEPIPDVTVVTGGNLDYRERHATPEETVLLVEVAISSAEYDLGGKAVLYAQAGISDYWVVLPEQQQIVVHREPSADGYAKVTRLGQEETISPLAAPEATLSVRELFGC